jgi:antitoxin PrlF
MAESTITAKGQTTVPQQVRDALGAHTGARLAWHVLSDGTVIVRAKTRSILDLTGSLTPRKGSKHVTVEQMRR